MPDRDTATQSIASITQLLLDYYIRRHVSLWDAEDLVQEVIIKLLRMGRVVEDVERPYLYTVARTVLIDKYRADSRHKQQAHTPINEDMGFEDETACPDYQLQTWRLQQRFEMSLQGLTDSQRKTFIACKLEGLPMQQVAEQRRVSVSAVEKLMSKAKQSLLLGIAS